MVEISMKSIAPKSGGGLVNLLVIGLALAVIFFVAMGAFNFMQNAASNFLGDVGQEGLASSLGLTQPIPGTTTGQATIATAGLLGVGEHPYNTVTFSQSVKDGLGTSYSSISQYVWDEEPQNWGNPLEIDNDYTTPKGTNGQSISVPLTSTITDSTMTASLATVLAEKAPTTDASGNIIPENKTYYVHGAISGAPDLFYKVTVPNAGKVDSTAPTVTLPDMTLKTLDTTAWTSAAIDLGVDTNTTTGDIVSATIAYRIADNNVAQVKSVKVDDLNKLADDGTLDYVTISFADVEWTPYDYSSGIDETAYDGSTGFDAKLLGSDVSNTGILTTVDSAVNVDLEVEVSAATCATTASSCGAYSGGLANTQTLFTLTIDDIEGNTLVSQVVRG